MNDVVDVTTGELIPAALTVDPEFKALIPPLSADEYGLLQTSILGEGCRDAIVVWQGQNIILDGHNRYTICTAHGVPFRTVERAFDTRSDAKVWMLTNQLARRNLPEPARVKLALELKPALEEQARERKDANLKQGTTVPDVAHVPHRENGRTRDKVAEQAGVSSRKMSQAEYVLKKAPVFIRDAYEALDIAARPAYELARKLEKAPDDVQAFAAQYRVLSADKVDYLIHLHKSARDTFTEFAASGFIQPGEEHEAVDTEASLKAWQTAITLKAKIHKQMALDEKHARVQSAAWTPKAGAPVEVRYTRGDSVMVGPHTLMCADNQDDGARALMAAAGAQLVFADPPYNADVAEWDTGDFTWAQDFLMDYAPIVAVTPGIGNIPGFMRQTAMPYRWSTATVISNGMTRGALGFGNWIYTALFSKGSIHRNAQDVYTVTINARDADELGAKRQKPPMYLSWLFDLLTKPGATIIDPFAGSGTSVIVAHNLGRVCIAIERDEDTFNSMVARVRGVVDAQKAEAA